MYKEIWVPSYHREGAAVRETHNLHVIVVKKLDTFISQVATLWQTIFRLYLDATQSKTGFQKLIFGKCTRF